MTDESERPPRVAAERRRKKRGSRETHFLVRCCPFGHRSHSHRTLGVQVSQCL